MFISFYSRICYVLPPSTYFTSNIVYMSVYLCYFTSIMSLNDVRQVRLAVHRWQDDIITPLNQKPQISFARNKWQEKIQVFWDLMPCWLVSIYRRFGVVFHLQLQGLTVSQTLLTIYQSTWHHIPQEWNLHQHCCENLKSWTSGRSVFSDTIMYAFSAKVANVLNAASVEEQIM